MRKADVSFICLFLCLALFGATSAENIQKHKGPPVEKWISNIRKNSLKFGLRVNISQTILSGANAESVPFFVTILTDIKICGGVLINPRFALTSVTCIEDMKYGSVVYGEYSLNETAEYVYGIDYVYQYPEYNCGDINNDLAVIYMYAATLSETSQVARFYSFDNTTNYEGKTVYFYGFGSTSADNYTIPNVLQTKTHVVQPVSYCQSFEEFKDMNPDNTLCTLSVGEQSGACHGDEGGPVMVDGPNGEKQLIGITTYQPYMCPPSADFPSRHTRFTDKFINWLRTILEKDETVEVKRSKKRTSIFRDQRLFDSGSAENVKNTRHKGSPSGTWITTIRENSRKLGLQVNISQTILAGGNSEPVPYFVAIETITKICGGVLLSKAHVLTSASCLEDIGDFAVLYFGQNSLNDTVHYQIYEAGYSTVRIHEAYNCTTLQNDLAMFYLENLEYAISFGASIKPAVFYEVDDTTHYEGKTVYLYGFGTTSADSYVIPSQLQTKTHVVQPLSYCQSFEEFQDMNAPYYFLCTKSVGEQSGACHGDEGGPVVITGTHGRKLLIGITSYQPYQCPPSADFPSRHTNLAGHLGWIQYFIGGIDTCSAKKTSDMLKLSAQKRRDKHFGE